MERIRPAIVGDIQMMREGEISAAADNVMTPNAVCARWRRAMLLNGIDPSSRRCGFQPVSRPDRICATDPDWISIMIAANAAEMMISANVEAISASAPPAPRRVLVSKSAIARPRNLGASRTPIVTTNNAERARSRSAARPETGRIPW